MKNINPLGLFDDHFLLETLSKLGYDGKDERRK